MLLHSMRNTVYTSPGNRSFVLRPFELGVIFNCLKLSGDLKGKRIVNRVSPWATSVETTGRGRKEEGQAGKEGGEPARRLRTCFLTSGVCHLMHCVTLVVILDHFYICIFKIYIIKLI